MCAYSAPLDDISFALCQHGGFPEVIGLPAFEHVEADVVPAVLDAVAKFVADDLAPIARRGNQQGCTLSAGSVTTPDGFKEAYARFVKARWAALEVHPDRGGDGLPSLIGVAVEEMLVGANLAF